jgi:hypothetical protein
LKLAIFLKLYSFTIAFAFIAQLMDNSVSDPNSPRHSGEGNLSSPDALSKLVNELETEENLKKLAEKLGKEWKGKPGPGKAPDLSYEKFEKKLKENPDQ